MAFFEVSRQVKRRLDLAADLPTDHPPVLGEIDALVDQLPDPEHLCAEERAGALAAVAKLRNRLDAYLTETAATADEHADSRVLGAGTTGMMVAVATGANPAVGSATVARGNALQYLPLVAASFREGKVSTAHVAVITAEAPKITNFHTIEAQVVTIAETVEPAELRRILTLLADQCRPDALTDLTTAGAANKSPLGVSQVSVLVDLEDLSSDGAVLDDDSALGTRMLDLITCTAIVSVILGTRRENTFVPLALARGKRTANHDQWRALTARDRGCIRCGRTPRYCQAHHIHHWRHGGKTDVSNMVLLCSRCHHDLHHGHYTVQMHNGIPHITPTATRAPPQTALGG
ncbi:MAG: DUF222 domain-containing protein [Actinobacteria bacterium]|nr:DUF222 domain-containing protein [Actinomycetota bacterium]